MRNPSSVLRGAARRLRRPSPAMIVALVALFLSAGGVSYAAATLPARSVGPDQLRTFAVTNPKIANNAVGTRKIMNNAVTFNKIKPASVGVVRIVKTAVQLRVNGTCTSGNQAITSVNVNGGVTCGTTSSVGSNSGASTANPLSSGSTTLASFLLAGGSPYFIQAAPSIDVVPSATDAAQRVRVTCKLAAGPSTEATETRAVTLDIPAGTTGTNPTISGSIPLMVAAPQSSTAITASLSCTAAQSDSTASPTVTAQGTIYAMTISSPSTTTTTTTTTPTTTTGTTTTPAPLP